MNARISCHQTARRRRSYRARILHPPKSNTRPGVAGRVCADFGSPPQQRSAPRAPRCQCHAHRKPHILVLTPHAPSASGLGRGGSLEGVGGSVVGVGGARAQTLREKEGAREREREGERGTQRVSHG
eukprot:452650-Rhodomonas_salina.1